MLKHFSRALGFIAAVALCFSASAANNLRISTGVGQQHFWVGQYMDPFIKAMENQTELTFTAFYSGSLVALGHELEGLKAGTIAVAAPLAAPYNEGRFPLSDVTQLPTLQTNSVMVTNALLDLMESDKELVDGKTFYQYELGDKHIRGWPVGATTAYSLSTTGKVLDSPEDLKGFPMRAGSPLHTIVLQQLGATPVTMTSSASYEALSRGTVGGTILSVADWPSYSMQDLLKYTITGISMGHWESYLAVTDSTWDSFTDKQQQVWNKIARRTALDNAAYIDKREIRVRKNAVANGATFVDVETMSPQMQNYLSQAASQTWTRWIEKMEKNGHPGRETALLWAELIRKHGGEIPASAVDYLELQN